MSVVSEQTSAEWRAQVAQLLTQARIVPRPSKSVRRRIEW
jgi:hypothetical protein